MTKKRVLRLLLVVIVIGLLGVGGWIYFELTGTPWERATARKSLEAYLQKRFTQKMDIKEDGLAIEFPSNGFYYTIHPEGSDYWIRVQQQGRGSPNFIDDYYTEVWETEAKAKIQAFLQTIYAVETNTSVDIERANFSQFPQWGISEAPSLIDLRAAVSDYRLAIWVTPDFDQDHPDREYEDMYRVIQSLKESALVPGSLFYYFGYPDPSSNKDYQSYIRYYFSQDDFQAITSVQSMITILEKYDDGSPTHKVFH